ncbi:hypothetical protein GBAR_LOCUS21312 [Geodia barretti]|uniref:Large ribosomal subunit protein bL21m n=1 Tax=Geodia barretti TaxID=519541 RepID=A0AA35SY27_GEOBA|nr:hypothetical protein GBAR_LOCUS21312 [Geodia barretti]
MAACGGGLIRLVPRRSLASNGLRLVRGLGSTPGVRDCLWQPLRKSPGTYRHSLAASHPIERLQTRPLGLLSGWSTKETGPTTKSEVVEKVKEEIADVSPDKIFAVVHISGRQFKITQNDLIVINRIPADVGESIFLQKSGGS